MVDLQSSLERGFRWSDLVKKTMGLREERGKGSSCCVAVVVWWLFTGVAAVNLGVGCWSGVCGGLLVGAPVSSLENN